RLHCQLEGDGNVEIRRVAGIEHAGPGDLTFVANRRYRSLLPRTQASPAILMTVEPGTVENVLPPPASAILRSHAPYQSFARAVSILTEGLPPAKGVDRLSAIASDVELGPDVAIGAFVAIGSGASIGARTVVYANAVIGPGTRIGDDCVIHSHVS